MTQRAWAGVCGLVLCAAVAAWAADGPAIGKPAPGFTLTDAVHGQTYNLNDYAGKRKAIVVIWISGTCPVSEAYNERYKALFDAYHEKGVAFFAVNSNSTESKDFVAEHAKKNEFGFPVLYDAGNKVADAYNAQHTPEVFVLNTKLGLEYHGAIDNNRNAERVDANKQWLRMAIDAVLAGRHPDPSETQAFGCSVKRR